MRGGDVDGHPLDGLRWRITLHLLTAATLPTLAGLIGLHYLP